MPPQILLWRQSIRGFPLELKFVRVCTRASVIIILFYFYRIQRTVREFRYRLVQTDTKAPNLQQMFFDPYHFGCLKAPKILIFEAAVNP